MSGRVITWIDESTGNIMANWVTSCPGIYTVVVRVYRAPTADDLIPGFYGEVIAAIEAPSSAISPPASAPINLGLWLATDGPLEVRRGGTVGPFSVEVVAMLAETTFEMGNGDVVVCGGGGVAIVDVDTVDQGPCGYTYRQALVEGSEIVIGGRWEITYSTSLGDGVLADINTSSTVEYSTYEIQTVGQSG